jgi:hypothetical protein
MLIDNSMLDKFIGLFGYDSPRLKKDKIKIAKKIISKYSIPRRYLQGLNVEERLLRQIELVSKKRQTPKQRYKPLLSDKIAREKGIPKKGPCTKIWQSKYPEAKTNAQKSKVTGIPKVILDKVDNKGRGAYYTSGSRPGQTAESWGIARVNCFILNKKTVTQGPDRHLYEDAIRMSPRAKKWFSSSNNFHM